MRLPVSEHLRVVTYLGCWDRSGHYLHTYEGRPVGWDSRDWLPFPYEQLDGGRFQPFRVIDSSWTERSGQVHYKGPQDEGVGRLTIVDGWTILGFWDRSVDTRGGSCGAFVAIGVHDFEEMKWLAAGYFPKIAARVKLSAMTLEVQHGAS